MFNSQKKKTRPFVFRNLFPLWGYYPTKIIDMFCWFRDCMKPLRVDTLWNFACFNIWLGNCVTTLGAVTHLHNSLRIASNVWWVLGPRSFQNFIPGESWECSLTGVSSLMPGDFPRNKKVGLQLGPLKEEKMQTRGVKKCRNQTTYLPVD